MGHIALNSSYSLLDYTPKQWAALSGLEARKQFRALMDVRLDRVEGLARVTGIPLDGSDRSFVSLSEWMLAELRPDPERETPDAFGRSVARDVGLYLGETLVTRWPQLKWDLVTSGPTFADYREPVVSGFADKYERRSVCALAYAQACDLLKKDRFDIVHIGDGDLYRLELGPVDHEYLADVVRTSKGML